MVRDTDLSLSEQGLVETAMLAVETGDWDVARGKIREAREMLARAGLQDSVGTSSGSLQSDSSSKIMHLSDMVCRSWSCFMILHSVAC